MRLADGAPKDGTHISATNIALEDMRMDQGIQVRTDVYVDGHGKTQRDAHGGAQRGRNVEVL